MLENKFTINNQRAQITILTGFFCLIVHPQDIHITTLIAIVAGSHLNIGQSYAKQVSRVQAQIIKSKDL